MQREIHESRLVLTSSLGVQTIGWWPRVPLSESVRRASAQLCSSKGDAASSRRNTPHRRRSPREPTHKGNRRWEREASARGGRRDRARASAHRRPRTGSARKPLDSTRVSPTGFPSFLHASERESMSFLPQEIVSPFCTLSLFFNSHAISAKS